MSTNTSELPASLFPDSTPTGFRQLLRCVLPLLGVIIFGTVGFHLTEDNLSVWRSLYFTLITVTTVGYEDHVSSDAGRVLTSILLVLGIGTFTYTVGEVVRSAVGFQHLWMRRMQSRIDQLQSHVIVCGFGRMGRSICERLRDSGLDVVVLEHHPEGWQSAVDHGYLAVRGCATDDEVLREAGIDRAAGVACVMDSDADNTFCVLSVREMNDQAFIACRADSDASVRKLERAGATLVVCPHAHAGVDLAHAIVNPSLAKVFRNSPRSEYGFEMSEVRIGRGSLLAGQSIAEFGRHVDSVAFVAIRRAGEEVMIRPGGNVQFLPDDVVIVAGKVEELSKMYSLAQGAEAAA